ncbi:MAG: L,D-transpeptidase family protein [Candidatus Omnitrophica bacterium]|nr:L,D-transpeptidase family protein [Candidatus Omnitrophota bacterium]MDD5592125.1 L,D-transpeptidase family protein [Candidatus Omnitrophota bacterium]
MNRRIVLGIITVLIAAVIFTLVIKKINRHWQIKAGRFTSASGMSTQAAALLDKGDLFAAKSIYQQMINDFPNSRQVVNWQKKIEEINIKLLFSSVLTPKSVLYEIKPGDTLTKIAREFKTTTDLIKKSNGISGDRIAPGEKIKVWVSPFSIVVDKSQNILILKTDEEVVKTYIVSTGKNNSTPIGTFKIINKLANPTWFKTGAVIPSESPENILGSRWLGFDLSGYGIHGTTEPQNLGKQVTQGCVRMANSDVEELYTLIPVGTEVTIVD